MTFKVSIVSKNEIFTQVILLIDQQQMTAGPSLKNDTLRSGSLIHA